MLLHLDRHGILTQRFFDSAHRLLHAFALALNDDSDCSLTGSNVFEVMGCAALLRREKLRNRCELSIIHHLLSYKNFSGICRYAKMISASLNDDSLLKFCHGFMKRIGVEPWKERNEGSRGQKRDERRKFELITRTMDVPGDDEDDRTGSNSTKKLKFDVATGEFVCQQSGRCSLSLFNELLSAEKAKKARHFKQESSYPISIQELPPPFNTNLDQLEEDCKKGTTGYPGMRLCYLERRRGMGPTGEDTHYVS